MKILFLSLTLLAILNCTDRAKGKWKALGGKASIQCYSGNILIYEGTSTGKISSEKSSDGYSFIDNQTKMLTEISGNCIIKYLEY